MTSRLATGRAIPRPRVGRARLSRERSQPCGIPGLPDQAIRLVVYITSSLGPFLLQYAIRYTSLRHTNHLVADTQKQNTMTTAQEDIYDVLGVGFGPANLAIATAFADHNVAAQKSAATADPAQVASGKKQLKVGFVESHPEFRWHPGMMVREH